MQPTSGNVEVTLRPTGTAKDSRDAAGFGIAEAPADDDRWQFGRRAGRLALCSPRAIGPLRLEVQDHDRRLRTTRRDDPLPRAVGLHRTRAALRVVDATGGICRDAMILAHMGCQVTVLERVPALALFGHWSIATAGLAARAQVIAGDATAWLQEIPETDRPDVVYLDPMFDGHGRAQVKKAMQVCRLLAGPPGDPLPLLAAGRAAARARVAVKRHPDLPPLTDGVSFTVTAERVRFDVYLAAPPTPSATNEPRDSR